MIPKYSATEPHSKPGKNVVVFFFEAVFLCMTALAVQELTEIRLPLKYWD